MNQNWICLIFAALLEVMWVIGLAHSSHLMEWILTILLIVVSNYVMIRVAQVLAAGTVYTVFVGLGAAGTVLVEIIYFGEAFSWIKIALIISLLIGVIGLKFVTEEGV